MAQEREIHCPAYEWVEKDEGSLTGNYEKRKIERPDLVGKVVRLKSHNKFGIISKVDWKKHKDEWIYFGTAEVIWIVGYLKPKTTNVSLTSLYRCDDFIADMQKELNDYRAKVEKVTDYYDKP